MSKRRFKSSDAGAAMAVDRDDEKEPSVMQSIVKRYPLGARAAGQYLKKKVRGITGRG